MPGQPYNLPDHTVHLTLQYLLPPVPPLPAHLLSNPLRQRHLLLHTSDGSYFCWPSSCPSPDRLLSLLESLSSSSLPPSRISKPAYALPDEHTLLASVDIGGLVRLVWRWECERNEWGYHDAMLLPAPIGTPVFPHSDVREALYSLPRNTFLDRGAGQPNSPRAGSRGPSRSQQGQWEEEAEGRDPLDDGTIRPNLPSAPSAREYWGSSSRSPSPETARGASAHRGEEEGDAGEDAYWARYGQVGGTADSTVPSPVPPERFLSAQAGQGGDVDEKFRVMDRERERERQESGAARHEREHEHEHERDVDMESNSPRQPARPLPLPQPEDNHNHNPRPAASGRSRSGLTNPAIALIPSRPRYPEPPYPDSHAPDLPPSELEYEEDLGLYEALRGIWRMYSKGAGGLARACRAYGAGGEEREREKFMDVARRVVEER